MASSLEELLAEDGFRGKRSTRSRASSASDNITTMLYRSPGDHKPDSSSRNRTRTQRTRSDVSRYSLNEKTDSIGSRRPPPRDHLITRERTRGKSTELLKGRHSVDRPRDRGSGISSGALSRDEIVEVGLENDERINDRYSSKSRKTFEEDKFPTMTDARNQSMPKDTKPDRRRDPSSSHKHLPRDLSSTQSGRTSMKQAGPSEDRRHEKHNLTLFDSLPSLDEVAIKATISILTGYITPFLKDENFRVALRSKCFSSLDFDESEDYQSGESKVMSSLKQAIETVERAAEEYADPKDLKRASIQLSVITGLNTGDMKDGLTCGVPNFKLSACAHLYLSLIYKMQKKDRVSAKHILQIFADLPLEGRTLLLPDLWENFFYPHLSHLELWHTQEVESLVDVTGKATKLNILEKVYNEMLDLGTCQFAVYYKEWLTEDAEAPAFPSVNVPSVSVRTAELGDSPSHSGELGNTVSALHQPMVSKKLYEAVFGRSNKPGAEDDEEGQNYQKGLVRSTSECNDALIYSCETVKHMDQHSVSNSTRHLGDDELSDGRILLLEAIDSPQKHKHDEISTSSSLQQTTVEDESRSSREPNQLIKLQRLAISAFEPEQTENFDIEVDIPSWPKAEPFCRGDEHSDEGNYTIPQYLLCPLTRRLFEDPVTLETGQTFERAAIRKWFDEGNKSCPVTGTSLEYLGVPRTNMVIKSVVDSWKTEHSKSIFAFASRLMGEETQGHQFVHSDIEPICILEQLITIYSREERKANVKHLLSLGVLHYLIGRFNVGKIEVNIGLMPIVLCCIEADSSCIYEILKGINIHLILDLLQSKKIDVRRNVVSLLIKLISLQRRKDVADILGALPKEEIVNTMHVLLLYLQTSLSQERPLVAALLLRLDQLVGPQKYSIYRDGAVDAIAVAMNLTKTDPDVKTACCKALSILFPLSGKLPEAGLRVSETEFENKESGLFRDQSILYGDEDPMFRKWLTYLLTSLTSDERKPFLEAILKCLASGESSLVLACLQMVAWLSFALPSEMEAGFKFSAFSALNFQLKENLKGGEEEHKILASFCLLNFSKISECRAILKTDTEEIAAYLKSAADISWTAKELYSIVCSEDL